MDTAECLRDLDECGSSFFDQYPAEMSRLVRAIHDEEDRVFVINQRVGALRSQLRSYR